ncbi:hypothetical protein CPC08DRAFT_273951 [Agrocybe pediades]|nr:hypothetical protein CPC08DRAFT_273951 [Agrocybe pediades]
MINDPQTTQRHLPTADSHSHPSTPCCSSGGAQTMRNCATTSVVSDLLFSLTRVPWLVPRGLESRDTGDCTRSSLEGSLFYAYGKRQLGF